MRDNEQNRKSARQEELDRFWEIDDLIPVKKAIQYPSDTETVELTLDEIGETTEPKVQPLPPRKERASSVAPDGDPMRRRADEEYSPDHVLVRKVRIFRRKSDYAYYEAFIRDAKRLYPIHGLPVSPASFFSYVPQYSQMTRAQLEWYLWWRENLRQGKRLDTDYSYLLLYAYELINLSEKIDPTVVRDGLFKLWSTYREVFYQLDTYLPDWICDCCLLHRLPPPQIEDPKLLTAAMSHCRLREFYLNAAGEDGRLDAMLTFCCNYDYKRSKFYTEEHAPLYDRVIKGVLREVSGKVKKGDRPMLESALDDSKMLRDSYVGALCASSIKRHVEVEYFSFSRSHELRFLITDIVKYTENRIRQSLGIRSRLGIYALPTSVRAIIDAYLVPVLPSRTSVASVKREELRPDYERFYDAPRKPLSSFVAREIERSSWETTRRLVEAFETVEEQPSPVVFEEEKEEPKELREPLLKEAQEPSDSGAWAPYLPFLQAVRRESKEEQRAAARNAGVSQEVLADRINELAADCLGDILLEENDGLYTVIEEYGELLEQLIEERKES